MFNLDSLSLKDSVSYHVRHPVTDELLYGSDGLDNPVEIELYGTSSKTYRIAISAMQNRALKRGKKQATAENLKEEGIELLVACSVKANNLSYAGNPIKDEVAFRALYSDPAFSWLKDQVDAALGDNSNFLPA